jgi:hypothetical protein
VSIVVTGDGVEESLRQMRLDRAETTGGSADAALQAGYANETRSSPSPLAHALVRVAGVTLALRLAPRLLLDAPEVRPAGGGTGWVRLRCASEATDRRRCLERQGALMALPTRFDLAPFILEEPSCVARGDAVCEYLLHCRRAPRWGLVAAAAGLCLVLGAIARADALAILVLAAASAAATYAWERRASERSVRATRIVSSRALRRFIDGAREAEEATSAARSVVAVETPPEPRSEDRLLLAKEGDVWRVSFEGATIRMRHSRGMELLSHLLRHPGEELHVQTLDALVPSASVGNERTAVNPDTLPPDGMSFGLGDAGPVIDDRARADYRRRLTELRAEFEDAERCNDPGRAAAARVEIDQLVEELRAATGLGGRARRASSDADRMRIAVTRRIRAAIEQLGKLHPALGDHLERSVRTGFACCYAPVEHAVRKA